MSFISYLIILLISLFFNLFPRRASLFFGKLFGLFIYYILPIRKKVALQNIKDNFPELNNQKKLKILKNTYIHFGMILSDFLRTKKLNENNINNIIYMDDKTRQMLKDNKGAIIMTGHLGNWEYFLPTFGLNGFPFSIVAQKIKNPYLNRFFLKTRTIKNVNIIFKKDGTKKMLQALKNQNYLGLASDQNAGKKGLEINFLNIKTSIPKGAAIFHIKTGAPIIIGYCIMDKNKKYTFSTQILDTSDINFEKDDAIYTINRKFTDSLGRMIKKYPNQYFWFHKMKSKKAYK